MKKGVCPKCGSTEVYHYYYPDQWLGGIQWGGGESGFIRINTNERGIGTVQWDSYLCTECGFFEHYILDKKLREVIKDPKSGWVKVNP